MNTSSSAPPAPLPALLLLAAALYTALALGLPAPFGSAQTVMRWAFVAAVTFAWLLAVQVWWQRRTDVIAWLAAAMSVHALGKLWNLDFGLIEAMHNHSPTRLALDTLFFVLAGVALTKEVGWLRETGRWPGQLALLDTLMIAVIAGMGVWMLGLDALVASASEQPLLVGLLLAYGAAQILIISLSVMMLLRGIHSRVLGFVTAGLLLFGFADLYAVLTGDGAHERWLSLLWIWGMTLLALGMEQVVRTRLPPPAAAGLPPALRRTLRRLPYTAVLVCCALLLAGAFSGPQRQLGITVGTVAVFGLVMLRQAKIAQANRQMHAQLEASRRDLEHLAYHDVLTGLPNRAAFTRFFATSLGPDEPYAIFSLDLNGFKNINDTYGHAVGDRMLRHAAQQLERAVAAPGQIFRWGGDEFVIVVPGVQRGTEAEALARFIAVNIQAPCCTRASSSAWALRWATPWAGATKPTKPCWAWPTTTCTASRQEAGAAARGRAPPKVQQQNRAKVPKSRSGRNRAGQTSRRNFPSECLRRCKKAGGQPLVGSPHSGENISPLFPVPLTSASLLPGPLRPLAVLLLAHALWIVLRRPHTPLDLWVSNGLGMAVTAASALLTWQLWRRSNRLSPHNNRHIHLLFLLAFLGQFVGNAFLIALGEEGQIYRDLSLGDVGYLTYYLLMTAALLRLMPIHLSTRRQAGQALDGLIIAGTAATGLWGWLLSDLMTGLQGPFGLLNVTYVLLDLVILSLSLMLLQIQQYSRSSLLLATGLIAFVAADIVYLAQGTLYQTGTSLDLLWSWGTGLQVAGLWALPRSAGRRPAALPRASKPLGLAAQSLPYATVLLASLMLGLTLPAPTPYSQGMLWGTVVVVALATVRQWLTIYDNRAITRELQQSRAELEYLAYHDHLTGLPNRTALTQFFGHGLRDTEPYTIFSLDLDGFKQINDMHGHVTGDQMLRHAAEQLQRAVPTPSRVFRWGGDEFVVVVPGLEHPADAAALAQRLLSSVQRPLLHGEHQLSVGTSVGYATGRGPQHYQTLLAQADQQMYRVKESSGKRR